MEETFWVETWALAQVVAVFQEEGRFAPVASCSFAEQNALAGSCKTLQETTPEENRKNTVTIEKHDYQGVNNKYNFGVQSFILNQQFIAKTSVIND